MPLIKKWPGSELLRGVFRLPARILIFGFLTLILLGTGLLMLPVSSMGPRLCFVDALFMSTSASCVTGLSVVDACTLSLFGQIVILVLIQAGGLGIMTVSTLFLLIAGKRPSLTEHAVVIDTFTCSGERGLVSIIREVVLFTLVIETAGAVCLFVHFKSFFAPAHAFYLAVFHAVSAFCNAGFSLFSDSLMRYRQDWILNCVICLLVIAGGIGFIVLSELKQKFPYNRRAWSRLSLHTKLVIVATGFLLCFSTLLIAGMEWKNTLAGMPAGSRLIGAFFQAVSARTAGFNTISIQNMANETLFLIMILMFIGAGPGSCAGGIKITTAAALVFAGFSKLNGHDRPQLFHRTITSNSIIKAMSLVMISGFIVSAGTMILLMTESGHVSHIASRGEFLELLFETVSAFGTVGLSTGVTAKLSESGRLLITLIMFIGRIGPMVITLAITRRITKHYYHAEEGIMIG